MVWSESTARIDQHKIFYQQWQTENTPSANVILIHGLGEHSSRYGYVANKLTESGISVLAMDLLGHGKSDGQRGHAESYDEYCRIVDYFIAKIVSEYPGIPLYLYGHSMGGLIALYFALNHDPSNLNGIISSSPGLATGFKVPEWKTTIGNMLYTIAPKFSMDNGLPLDGISQDRKVVEAYKKDPLNHPYITARMGMDLIRNGSEISTHAADFPVPLLLMVGSADRLVSPGAIEEFAARAGSIATLKVWDGGYHELHNEPFKNEVLRNITSWIQKVMTNAH